MLLKERFGKSFDIMRRKVHIYAFSQWGRTDSSKLSDDVLGSIELFKLTKPSMYSREIRERLLNDGNYMR